jgi:hypothetical protein
MTSRGGRLRVPRRYMPARTRVPDGKAKSASPVRVRAVDRSGEAAQRAGNRRAIDKREGSALAFIHRERIGLGHLRGDFEAVVGGDAEEHLAIGGAPSSSRAVDDEAGRGRTDIAAAKRAFTSANCARAAARRASAASAAARRCSIASAESAPESRIDSARSYSPRARTAEDSASATVACAARVCALRERVIEPRHRLALARRNRLHRPGFAGCARLTLALSLEYRARGALRR